MLSDGDILTLIVYGCVLVVTFVALEQGTVHLFGLEDTVEFTFHDIIMLPGDLPSEVLFLTLALPMTLEYWGYGWLYPPISEWPYLPSTIWNWLNYYDPETTIYKPIPY